MMNGDIVTIALVPLILGIKNAKHMLVQIMMTNANFLLLIMEKNIIIVLLQMTDAEFHGVQLLMVKMLMTWKLEVGDIVIIIVHMKKQS